MAEEARTDAEIVDVQPAGGPQLTPRQEYYARRVALGDSVVRAGRAVGLAERQSYYWAKDPAIEAAIRQYAAEAVDSARRVIVGKVRWAARRMIELGKEGGASHKGAAVEFAALKYILDINRVSEIQVGGTQSRILTFIPRDERDQLPEDVQDTLAVIDAQFREEALPLVATPDGLPPDFPRAEGERDGGYAQPKPTMPGELSDPAYFRRSLMRE